MESKVKKNLAVLKHYMASMQCAIEKAENGSECEDSYFLEKLEKSANSFNKTLVRHKWGDTNENFSY